MDLGLKGKNAIVTGGTRGIGRRIADLLADEGADVAVCSREEEHVKEATEALSKKGVRATGRALDIADGDALKSWIGDVADELGGLDILVQNVSAMATNMTDEDWKKSFDIDIMATVHASDAAIPFLEKSEAGAIVVVGTTASVEGFGGPQPYSAVKAAQLNLVSNLAGQLAPKGVRANVVSPGTVYFEGGVWNMIEQAMPDFFQTMVKRNPMGRMCTPEEVANAVVFLASPRASFISGTNLIVDGALTHRVQY